MARNGDNPVPPENESRSTDEILGVEILKGDPKRAIWKLSGPMIVAMLLRSSYKVVNTIWVADIRKREWTMRFCQVCGWLH
ncbi:MAG: hypothetical protein WCE46_08090 [Methanoregula sp.]|jgi:Na+-driven multidrug efflux pump|uniref:hypothetical protein n=1 Tax=Methanoregula sp. TaxID=2052170 RepID=UPI003C74CCA2